MNHNIEITLSVETGQSVWKNLYYNYYDTKFYVNVKGEKVLVCDFQALTDGRVQGIAISQNYQYAEQTKLSRKLNRCIGKRRQKTVYNILLALTEDFASKVEEEEK